MIHEFRYSGQVHQRVRLISDTFYFPLVSPLKYVGEGEVKARHVARLSENGWIGASAPTAPRADALGLPWFAKFSDILDVSVFSYYARKDRR